MSDWQERLVFKGGMLLSSLVGISARTTMDMDTTLRNFPLDPIALVEGLKAICQLDAGDDVTIEFNGMEPIRSDDEYGGYRVALVAHCHGTNTPIAIDVTTGDRITPAAITHKYRTLFESRTIHILAYNLETILAEKLETILSRNIASTRPKDFYDVHMLMNTKRTEIDPSVLTRAVYATAAKRESIQLLADATSLFDLIARDEGLMNHWTRYVRKFPYARGIQYVDVVKSLSDLLVMIGQDELTD